LLFVLEEDVVEVSVCCVLPGVVVFGWAVSSVWLSVVVWVLASTASATVTGKNDVKIIIAA
jgi:hypothetical protein